MVDIGSKHFRATEIVIAIAAHAIPHLAHRHSHINLAQVGEVTKLTGIYRNLDNYAIGVMVDVVMEEEEELPIHAKATTVTYVLDRIAGRLEVVKVIENPAPPAFGFALEFRTALDDAWHERKL